MSSIIELVTRAGNEALSANPVTSDIDIVTAASDFLWAIFSVMAATCIGIMVWGELGVKQGQRVFHYIAFAILATASVAYFCLASDLGSTPIQVEFIRDYAGSAIRPTRSIWYVRYIDWTITTPLLLLELLLVSGLPLSAIFVCIFSDLVMIVTGLVGALVESSYKWGLFTFGCVAMLHVFYILYGPGRKSAYALGDDFGKAYTSGAVVLSFLWFLYPIAWGLADGGNVISPTGEMVFYGVLDFLAKPCFAIYHLYALRNMNIDALHLSSGKFTVTENNGAADHSHPSTRRGEEVNVGGPSTSKADRMRDADATLDGHSS